MRQDFTLAKLAILINMKVEVLIDSRTLKKRCALVARARDPVDTKTAG